MRDGLEQLGDALGQIALPADIAAWGEFGWDIAGKGMSDHGAFGHGRQTGPLHQGGVRRLGRPSVGRDWMKLRDWWPLIVVLGLWVAVLSWLAGIAMGTSPAPDAPFGLLEMWINRYQTLIATGLAMFTLAVGLFELSANRAASRKQALLAVHLQLDAFTVATECAQSTKQHMENGEVPTSITEIMTETVRRQASPRLAGIFEQHQKVTDSYISRPDLREALAPTVIGSAELVISAAEYEKAALMRIVEIGE